MPDSLDSFAGDPAGARALREGLTALATHHAGTPLGDQIAAVLAGRTSLRDLAADPEFASMTTAYADRFTEEWRRLDPDERRALVAQGEAYAVEDEER